MSKPRKKCSCCGSKIYEDNLKRYWYPLLRKWAWHCEECIERYEVVEKEEDLL